MSNQRIVPIYTSRGDLGALIIFPYVYNISGEWIGFVTTGKEVYSVLGHYVGYLADGPRVLRKRSYSFDKPKLSPPPIPEPIRSPATIPLAPLMSEIPYSIVDVLEEEPDRMVTLDAGELRAGSTEMPEPDVPPHSGKTCSASRVVIAQLMNPEHANLLGNVHGGWIMKLVDEAGALAAMRHAQQRVVTVAVDNLTFKQPIRIGDLVTFMAEVSYVGRTSMEVEVRVEAENPITGSKTHTNTAHLVYVALDESGRTIKVPALVPETEGERGRMEQGRLRQEYRKSQRAA